MGTDKQTIPICNRNVVGDIESAFQLLYPYLRVEFFKLTQITATNRTIKIASDSSLHSLADIGENHCVNVGDHRTVAEVIKDFELALGTTVKMSRRSGNVWIAISLTDSWTLRSQNSAGRNLSDEMAI
jgi:hypothetical protein